MSEECASEGVGVCPAWCVLPHDDADHPAEVVHEAAPCLVPGVVLERRVDGTGRPARRAVAAELSVVNRPGFDGGSDDTEGSLSWDVRSTPMSCASGPRG